MAKSSREFDLYSANLALYRPEHAGAFVCPICLRIFPRKMIERITRAHVIPEALGGRVTTITCSDCNNKIGQTIESHEALRVREVGAMSGATDDTLNVTLEVYDSSGFRSRVTATMNAGVHGEQPMSFRVVSKASDPREVLRLQRWITQKSVDGHHDWHLNVSGRQRGAWERGRLTYLHAGFLMLFYTFGYEWALDPCTEVIREQLMKPQERLLEPILPKLGDLPDEIPDFSVHIVREPEELRGFLVIMPALRHIPARIGVWLPLFGNEYATISNLDRAQIQVTRLPEIHNRLDSPDSRMCGHALLQHCCP